MQRRSFLTSAAAGAGGLILPRGPIFGQNAPGNKLNIALIGVGGRGTAHYNVLSNENVAALCDINENALAEGAKRFPQAKHYIDWRKCVDQKDLDAVVCCTTDFTHAFVANWAMNRGLHVYCEKPLGITVEEARVVRATYLKNKNKLATQHGTQRHAYPNFNRVRELVRDGAIGELRNVSAWGNRKIPKPGYLPSAGVPPSHLHYELWIGPTAYHPYNPDYFSGGPGANCLQWNMYWDFGTGQIGDMGAHTMDLAWNALDAGLPLTAEAEGEPFNADVTPVLLKQAFRLPANDWRPAIDVAWHQGGSMPDSPKPFLDLNKIGHGAMFEGTKGVLVADFQNRLLIPGGDMTYYNRRAASEILPNMGGLEEISAFGRDAGEAQARERRAAGSVFQQEWIDACKGNLKTSCDFDYAGKMIEMLMLGLVAYRVGQKLEYDGEAGRVTNVPEANELLARKYRSGWTLNG